MTDLCRCLASRDGSLGGPRCQEEATHNSFMGRRCARHAEELRESLGKRARTEEEIAKLVVELPAVIRADAMNEKREKPQVTYISVVMDVDGKRRELIFMRSFKIADLLEAKESLGSFLRAFRDSSGDGP